MATTNLPLTTLTPNNILDMPVGTAIDQAHGMNIQLPTTSFPAAPNADHLFLLVQTTNGADKTVTIKGGVGGGATAGQAFRSGMGDLVLTAHAATGGGIIGPLESARFAQLDGSITLAFQSGITGTITAFIMPSRW
jgi:hypothetical protein